MERTARLKVLDLLKRDGPVGAEALARRLGVTAMAVRQHLYTLEKEGLAAHAAQASGRGRPQKMWRATERADVHFTDAHAALAADLIGQMKKAFGDKGVDQLLGLRTGDQEKSYAARLAGKSSLRARLDALAKIRSGEGYMAEVRRAPEGGYLFVENHCPICVAARFCQGLCREELALFGRVLGPHVRIERVSHILEGAGRCAYHVRDAA